MNVPLRRALVPATVACLFVASTACAGTTQQTKSDPDYPSRPISWIVPYEPGGGSDRQVRRLQPHLKKILGQNINVVYKPGGDGAVGWQELHSAKPDGYTMANVVDPNLALLSLKGGDAGFKAKDFRYVAWTEEAPLAMAVAKDSEFENLDEFVKEAKARPGKLTIAGIGEPSTLSLAQIKKATGIDVTYVPVSGGAGPIVTDLRGGHVDAAIFGSSHVLEHSSALRALAISGSESSKALPGVKTFEAQGYEGVSLGNAWGIALPPNTPDEIVQKLNKAVVETVEKPTVTKQLEENGLTPLTETPDEATAHTDASVKAIKEALKLSQKS